ncbi:hypothetical protein C9374_011700 [Naegleria lovaniensis]|uniref:GATA-type domain-containing protein n=1 Tax=Naegleria lovaniensis TaxID=51637 RepID=A0AA88G967_NAELO|nr:uncharacterized protein C9374_011700 [Naegleria lovaniensis]KAG2373815.1 hypothetical protein C9374_011700 [Naegleria lovaniensis]
MSPKNHFSSSSSTKCSSSTNLEKNVLLMDLPALHSVHPIVNQQQNNHQLFLDMLMLDTNHLNTNNNHTVVPSGECNLPSGETNNCLFEDVEQDLKQYLFSNSSVSSMSSLSDSLSSFTQHLPSVNPSLSSPPTMTSSNLTNSTTNVECMTQPHTTCPPIPSSFSPITGRPLYPRLRHTGKTKCANCQIESTPMWRKGLMGEILCNKCGLYLIRHGKTRPLELSASSSSYSNRSSSPNNSEDSSTLSNVTSTKKKRSYQRKEKKKESKNECHQHKRKNDSSNTSSLKEFEQESKKKKKNQSPILDSNPSSPNSSSNVSPHLYLNHSSKLQQAHDTANSSSANIGKIISILTQQKQPLNSQHALNGANTCHHHHVILPSNLNHLFMKELLNVLPNVTNHAPTHSYVMHPHSEHATPPSSYLYSTIMHTPLNTSSISPLHVHHSIPLDGHFLKLNQDELLRELTTNTRSSQEQPSLSTSNVSVDALQELTNESSIISQNNHSNIFYSNHELDEFFKFLEEK